MASDTYHMNSPYIWIYIFLDIFPRLVAPKSMWGWEKHLHVKIKSPFPNQNTPKKNMVCLKTNCFMDVFIDTRLV